jgi:hypothetical protein
MAASRPVAGIVPQAKRRIGGEIATGSRTSVVDRTPDRLPDLALKSGTPRRRGIRAAHADKIAGHRYNKIGRHASRVITPHLGHMEVDAESCATGPAFQTGHDLPFMNTDPMIKNTSLIL